jgi:hypothetical protein
MKCVYIKYTTGNRQRPPMAVHVVFVTDKQILHIHSRIISGIQNGPISTSNSTETQPHPIITIKKLQDNNQVLSQTFTELNGQILNLS